MLIAVWCAGGLQATIQMHGSKEVNWINETIIEYSIVKYTEQLLTKYSSVFAKVMQQLYRSVHL